MMCHQDEDAASQLCTGRANSQNSVMSVLHSNVVQTLQCRHTNLHPSYSCFCPCVVSNTIVADVWSSNDDGSKAPVPLQAEDSPKTVAYLCEAQLTLSVCLTVSLLLCIGLPFLPFLPFWGVASNLLSRQEVQQLFQSLWSCRRVMCLNSTTACQIV